MISLNIVLAIILIGLIIVTFVRQIKENMVQDDPVLIDLKNTLRQVDPIVDSLNFYVGNKSYTINKQNVYMCLKDKDGKYYDKNMLMYVALHEVAHAKCDEIGHTMTFHNIFQALLKKASEKGIYDPSKPIINDYCEYNPDLA